MNWYKFSKFNKSYKYSCVLARVEGNAKQSLLKWSKDNISDDVLVESDDAEGREDDMHVTVLYGLHDEDDDDVRDLLSEVEPFSIMLGEISKFEADQHDVIKISVSGQSVHSVNNKLRELPHTNKYDEYIPHLTLAYVKKNSCNDLLGNKYFVGKEIRFDKLVFSSSNGSQTDIQL